MPPANSTRSRSPFRGIVLAVSIGSAVVAVGLLVLAFQQRSLTLGLFERQLDLNEHSAFLTEAAGTLARAQLTLDQGANAKDADQINQAGDIVDSAARHIQDGAQHDARRLLLTVTDEAGDLEAALTQAATKIRTIAKQLESTSELDLTEVNSTGKLLTAGYRNCLELSAEMEITVAESTVGIRDQLESTLFFLAVLASFVGILLLAITVFVHRLLRTEARLSTARISAERANVAQSEFWAAMSHEIRTPMNGVIGTASILGESRLNEQQREHLETIIHSGELLLGIIDDILDFSKIDAQILAISPTNANLSTVVGNTMRLLKPQDTKNGAVELDLEIYDSVPVHVLVDEKRLTQILFNLLDNAIKFTKQGKVRLEVKVTGRRDDNAVMVEFAVKDEGIGIAANRLAGIFDGFSQADNSITRNHGGTGLGLSISKRLAELMGGSMHAESEPGKGSVFRFVLPLVVVEAPNHIREDVAAKPTKKRDIRILVVDDNKANRLLDAHMLRQLGYTAEFAENGLEAVHLCEQIRFDLVFMDMQMPVMDGIQATKRIHTRISPVPYIIALTANVLPEHTTECFEAGMNDFMSKPMRLSDMRSMIEKFTNSSLESEADSATESKNQYPTLD